MYIKYLCKVLDNNNYSFGYVHTPYTNKAVIDWIKSFNSNINIRCTATGVKNLHHEALKFDIAVYFESNGHGTLLINNQNLKNNKELKKLGILNNKIVGDGISGIFCVLYFLKELNLDYVDWYKLVEKNNNILYKKDVLDRSIFKTNKNGDRLTQPEGIQDKLDLIMDKFNCYCFVRPSGTENVIRIYIEGDALNLIKNEVNLILEKI